MKRLFIDEYGDISLLTFVMSWILGVLLFVVTLISFSIALDNHDSHVQCARLNQNTGLETKTVGTVGVSCYIKVGNSWIPSDKWINNTPTGR